MRNRYVFLVVLIQLALYIRAQDEPPPMEDTNETAALQLRLQEARTGAVYLTLEESQFVARIRNLAVKILPVGTLERLGPQNSTVVKVSEVIPASDFKPIIKHVETLTIDTTGAADSVDEILSLEDMPASFLIRFEDGSYIWVQSEDGDPILDAFRGWRLQAGAFLGYLWSGEGSRAIRLEMDSESARRLFWLSRPGTTLIL